MATCKRGDTTFGTIIDETLAALHDVENLTKSEAEKRLHEADDKLMRKYGIDIIPEYVGAGCGMSLKNNRAQRGGKCENNFIHRTTSHVAALVITTAIWVSIIMVYSYFNRPEPGKDYSPYMPSTPGAIDEYGSLPVQILEKLWTNPLLKDNKAVIDNALSLDARYLTTSQQQMILTFRTMKELYSDEMKTSMSVASDMVLDSLKNRFDGLVMAASHTVAARIQTFQISDITDVISSFYESVKDKSVTAFLSSTTASLGNFWLKVQRPEAHKALWDVICVVPNVFKKIFGWIQSLIRGSLKLTIFYEPLYNLFCKKWGGSLTTKEIIELNKPIFESYTEEKIRILGETAKITMVQAEQALRRGDIKKADEYKKEAKGLIEEQRRVRREEGLSQTAKEEVKKGKARSLNVASNSLPMNDWYGYSSDENSGHNTGSSSSAPPSSKNIRSYFPKK